MSSTVTPLHPVIVIGAGPVGLAAAAHLMEYGIEPLVLESGSSVGHHVRQWGHVRMFSPWEFNIDPAARRLLDSTGWQAPCEDELPTGNQLARRYLEPLAAHPSLRNRLRLGHRVTAVARRDMDRRRDRDRDISPFLVRVATPAGTVDQLARGVIDASGSWQNPNPLGRNGLRVPGEKDAGEAISRGIPDVLGQERQRFAGGRVLVAGSGHSAFNALQDLTVLKGQEPETRISWLIRRASLDAVFRGGQNDPLSRRRELEDRIRGMAGNRKFELIAGNPVEAIESGSDGIRTRMHRGGERVFDTVIASTGFRPDHDMHSELRLALDPALECPVPLAPLIDPNRHDCGSVPAHGVEELAHPETGFFLAGMKSYGRAPNFLLRTGYEQVRSIAAELSGDPAAARSVQITVPNGRQPCGSGQPTAGTG